MAMFRPVNEFYEKRGHVWVSPGVTPICGSRKNPAPHPTLPLGEYNPETRSHYVIEQGTFVSVQDGYLVPSTPAIGAFTLDAQDIAGGVLKADGSVPTVDESFSLNVNKPIGVVVWDILQNPMTLPNGYKTHLTQTAPTIRTEGVIVLPVVYTSAANDAVTALYDFKVGDSVAPDFIPSAKSNALVPTNRAGGIRKFLHHSVTDTSETLGWGGTIPADNPDFKVGRVLAVEHDYEYSTQGLDMVRSDGVDVQSESTHGFPRHIWNAIGESRLDATKKADFVRKIVFVNTNIK